MSVDVEFFVLDVELDKRQSRVQVIFAVQIPRIDSGIGRRLHVTSLKAAVSEYPLAVRPVTGENFPEKLSPLNQTENLTKKERCSPVD